ncbi:23S rRNA (guanosine(2251)-2'-O)-methyltransferase RlmB [Salibacterium halotolerans]|uniref:23S rRNA (Guanosine2251-2'-O)-methyltransferase n=1 Tax=Salibacterium halotolerans TaxID=1884432 RepID=A0A1I5WCZ2_9BACI|nr:23S rRNA (guanosine(2251)-2'-O)-methyltransferase RlmB [Salibacterium halotolerans]SFQ17623.1 23S rRNA (guanosine2251-2'-O)-methyltransferase [Salibacterium halotolerans]
MNEEWIYGKNAVLEALRAEQPIHKVWLAEGSVKGQARDVQKLAKDQGIVVQTVPRGKLNDLSGTTDHQGVLASLPAVSYAALDDLFEAAKKKKENPFFVLLDEISDPHNLGAVIRTADASGAHGVIIPKRRSAGLTDVVFKSSAGAAAHVPVARVTNMARTMEELKKEGLWLAGAAGGGSEDYRTLDASVPVGLVVGNEGKGMSRNVKEKCDFLLSIPMTGQVSSLNVSAAATLLMYEVYRRRRPLGSV